MSCMFKRPNEAVKKMVTHTDTTLRVLHKMTIYALRLYLNFAAISALSHYKAPVHRGVGSCVSLEKYSQGSTIFVTCSH